MTVTAPPVERPGVATGAYDRVFYSSVALAMAAMVFVGFAPTYYLRAWFGAPPTISGATTLSGLVQLHGALFTAWVLLFIAQTALIAQHRTRLHQRVGSAGGVLAGAMLIVGTMTAISNAARGSAPPGVPPLVFLIIPMTDMVLFAGFVGAALWYRRRRELHKRLMLLGYISIMAAAAARLPGVFPYGPLAFFGIAFLFLAAAIAYDYRSRGSIHPTYLWGGAVLVVSVPARLLLSETAVWLAIAEALTR